MLSDHVCFRSLDRTSCHCNTSNHIRVIESKFMSLDRRPLDQNIQVMHTGSNFMSLDQKRHSIGPAAY